MSFNKHVELILLFLNFFFYFFYFFPILFNFIFPFFLILVKLQMEPNIFLLELGKYWEKKYIFLCVGFIIQKKIKYN